MPAVLPTRSAPLPAVAERTLDNGLRVLAVRRPAVPLVELRLRVPFTGAGAAHQARAALLAAALFTGTVERDRLQLATAVQALGGSLSTGVDADRLAIVGSALASNLRPLLDLLAEVLVTAAYPPREVSGERDRLAQETTIVRSQPAVLAREALLRRLYGRHPYGSDTPLPDAVTRVRAAQLRTLHARRVSPVGSVLTLVGALRPAEALDDAEASLGGWAGGAASPLPPVPERRPGPVVVVDRPGAVQTNIRLGGPALDRRDPAYAAQQLASTVFGGYFTSRLVSNIREDKGYSYSPRSGVEHMSAVSHFGVGADVATEVTGPALLEILYELGRMVVLPVGEDELEAARQYAIGTLALSTATSAGLASTLSVLAGAGLGAEYLREHPAALTRVTPDDVLAVAGAVLAPARLATVLLGDREKVASRVSALREVAST